MILLTSATNCTKSLVMRCAIMGNEYMHCAHTHLLNMKWCYRCGLEFENPWVWKYGPLW